MGKQKKEQVTGNGLPVNPEERAWFLSQKKKEEKTRKYRGQNNNGENSRFALVSHESPTPEEMRQCRVEVPDGYDWHTGKERTDILRCNGNGNCLFRRVQNGDFVPVDFGKTQLVACKRYRKELGIGEFRPVKVD